MRVYFHGTSTSHRIFVTPGVDYPETSAWREDDGRFKQFEIHFINGEAEVDDNLGQYLIEKEQASATKIILPKEAA